MAALAFAPPGELVKTCSGGKALALGLVWLLVRVRWPLPLPDQSDWLAGKLQVSPGAYKRRRRRSTEEAGKSGKCPECGQSVKPHHVAAKSDTDDEILRGSIIAKVHLRGCTFLLLVYLTPNTGEKLIT